MTEDIYARRPDVDEYFSKMTRLVAQRSTCIIKERQFGALIVKNRQVISTGYNGAPRGITDCMETQKCPKREKGFGTGENIEECIAVHAEANALLQAGRQAQGATLYSNGDPCRPCARMIINSGVARVVVSGEYSDKEGLKVLEEAGIEVEKTHA